MNDAIALLEQALAETSDMERAQQEQDWDAFSQLATHREELLHQAFQQVTIKQATRVDRLTRELLKKNLQLTKICSRERDKASDSLVQLLFCRVRVAAYENTLA